MVKYFFIILVTLFFVFFLYLNRNEVRSIFVAISDSTLRWVFLAALAQIASYYFVVTAHRISLEITGIKRKEREILPLVLAALVINTTAPTGGASGAIIFANDAKEKNDSPTAAATAIILVIACYFIGLLSLLSFILIYLKIKTELGLTEIISTLILFFFTALYIYLIINAKRKPETIQKILEKFNYVSYKFKRIFTKKSKFSKKWPTQIAEELRVASSSIHDNPKKILEIIAMDFGTHFFNITALFFIFLSFGDFTKFGIIIAGYAIGELFKIVSPAPEGIGVTEASMAVVYTSFGINPIDATAISLVYRGLNFWIPFLIGFIVLQAKHLRPRDFKNDFNLD
jgi:uncharacterized protein (TIRG00374 family)